MPKRRAPITAQKSRNIKPEKARKLIRQFHILLKQQKTASGPVRREIDDQIKALGGLETYQQASLSGQRVTRGGDSSRVLVEWIRQLPDVKNSRPSLLEVGSLHVDNACTRSRLFNGIVRIDLNSQDPRIEQQDFMERPLGERFGCVSLSLVLNFVADAAARGAMLLRTREFLIEGGLLFLVIPLPCVDNSRYFDRGVFDEILASVGYEIVCEKSTSKLIYWLLKKVRGSRRAVPKRLVNDGPSRNNFSVVI